jgi:hypothetical protein
MADPQFPIVVPTEQLQEDGVIDTEPIYQTHRGAKPGQVRFTENEPPPVVQGDPLIRPTTP